MWTRYSGLLIWKTANPWAGLRGTLNPGCLRAGRCWRGWASGVWARYSGMLIWNTPVLNPKPWLLGAQGTAGGLGERHVGALQWHADLEHSGLKP